MSMTQRHIQRRVHAQESLHELLPPAEEKVFPGMPGPLHSSVVAAIHLTSPLQTLLHDLNLEQIVEMSSMFNFIEDTESRLIGTQKVIAQLDDSSWSSAFTLESAGVNQVNDYSVAVFSSNILCFLCRCLVRTTQIKVC